MEKGGYYEHEHLVNMSHSYRSQPFSSFCLALIFWKPHILKLEKCLG